jgi:uncharacterized protein YjbI with pentapeptide repeats
MSVGAFGSGPNEAQAAATVRSATLPKFCAGCNRANLSNPFYDLVGAYLAGADYTNTSLYLANLRYADLYNANLSGTNLSYSTLINAKIDHAYLSATNLGHADMTGARGIPINAGGVIFDSTICPDGTNSDVIGGSCGNHWLP